MAEEENNTNTDAVEEPSVTMLDVLEEEKKMEEEYAAVFGASDEKCCTYKRGHVTRQALYSCLTCCPDARDDLEKCAGICLACSYQCHENHELFELYTKRNFRCDCPTERINGGKCTLNAEILVDGKKMPKNVENLYNQNFQGLYCTCKRPYPDPENPSEEMMLQCVVCEDWYHLNHLDVEVVKLREDYHEMICSGCMQKYDFLQDYTGLALKRLEATSESADVSLVETDDKLKSDLEKSISEIMNMGEEVDASEANTSAKSDAEEKNKDDQGKDEAGEPSAKRQKLSVEERKCKRPEVKTDWEKGATFWPTEWRSALCECAKCVAIYKEAKVAYLLDEEDSATHYEERGKRNVKESSYEQGIRALSTIGHSQQIDVIIEYNHMKDKLKEYLKTFVAARKVVTEDDINKFFQDMKNEKNANLGQPYFCR